MNLTPQQMQEAITQYLQKQPQVPDAVQSSKYGFTPYEEQEPNAAPQLMLTAMEEDLVACLHHTIDAENMKLLTPENVFLQQVLRRLNRLESTLGTIAEGLAVAIQQKQQANHPEEKPATTTQLIFKEPEEQPDVPEEKATPKKKKRVQRRRRASAKTRSDGEK